MAYHPHVNEYQKNAIHGASPVQLVVMLYDGALKFLSQAREAMTNRDIYEQNQSLQKAQKIVSELTACLDMERGGEVARNLFGLYSFVYNELVKANIEDDLAALERAHKVLDELRQSWLEIQQQSPKLEVRDQHHGQRSVAA